MYRDYLDYSYDYTTEGANLDIRAILKEGERNYRANMAKINKAMKAENYQEARSLVSDLIDDLNRVKSDIQDIDGGDAGSIIFGLFTSWTINWLRKLVMDILSPVTFGLTYLIEGVQQMIESWSRPVSKAMAGDVLTADDFNAYKNTALKKIDALISVCNKVSTGISKNETKSKQKVGSDSAVKESAVSNFKYALYEACNSGIISISEREAMLNRVLTNVNESVSVDRSNDYNSYDFGF